MFVAIHSTSRLFSTTSQSIYKSQFSSDLRKTTQNVSSIPFNTMLSYSFSAHRAPLHKTMYLKQKDLLPNSVYRSYGKTPCLHSNSIKHYPTNTQTSQITQEAINCVAKTYAYVTASLLATATSATLFYQNGIAEQVLDQMTSQHPLISFIKACMIITPPLTATLLIPSEYKILKHFSWLSFNIGMGVLCSPLAGLPTAILTPALATTLTVTGGLTLTAMSTSDAYFLKYKAPIYNGLSTVLVASVFSLTAPGSIGALSHQVSLYGGLAVFSALMLVETQELLRKAQENPIQVDPVNDSIKIYLDVVNLHVRILELFTKRTKDEEKIIILNSTQQNTSTDLNTMLINDTLHQTFDHHSIESPLNTNDSSSIEDFENPLAFSIKPSEQKTTQDQKTYRNQENSDSQKSDGPDSDSKQTINAILYSEINSSGSHHNSVSDYDSSHSSSDYSNESSDDSSDSSDD